MTRLTTITAALTGIMIIAIALVFLPSHSVAAEAIKQPAVSSANCSEAAGTSSVPATKPTGSMTMEEEVLKLFKQRLPLRYERLMKLKATNPKEYILAMEEAKEFYCEYKRMPRDVQDYQISEMKMKVRCWQIAEQLRRHPSQAETQKLTEELRGLVARRFEAEQKVLEFRLDELEKEIARLKKKLQERSQQREKFIQDRLEKILRASTQPASVKERKALMGE